MHGSCWYTILAICFQKFCGHIPVDWGNAQGRAETFTRVDRYSIELRAGMICPKDHDHLILLVLDLIESIGAYLTGIDIACVRDDDGDRFFDPGRDRVLQELFDCEL